jgi:glutathione peroxidase
MSHADLYDITVKQIDGVSTTLADYRGDVLLVVNVASKCGLTPQYEQLEALYQRLRGKGFTILGFPANDFMAQEPGTDEDIKAFCSTTFDVQFPLFSKIPVVGNERHPLYTALIAAQPERIGEGPMRERLEGHGIATNAAPEVLWNFEKFVVDRKGDVIARFAPDVGVDDPRVQAVLDKALAEAA